MAEKTIKGRLILDRRTFQEWTEANPVAKFGEIMIVEVPASTDAVEQEPCFLLKVGDGVKTFNQLNWISALSADVYEWALSPTKPTYSLTEITGLQDALDQKLDVTALVGNLPIASATQAGIVKINTEGGLNVAEDGTISVKVINEQYGLNISSLGLNIKPASNSEYGTVKVSPGNGLLNANGTISMRAADNSTDGALTSSEQQIGGKKSFWVYPEVILGAGNPTSDRQLVIKKYVDDQISGVNPSGVYLPLSGNNAMTGNLNMGSHNISNIAEPTNAQDAVTKNYVDIAISGIADTDDVWSGTLEEYNDGKSTGEITDETVCVITDDDFYTNVDLINQLNNKINISDESSLNVNSANILNKPSWDANPEVFMNRGSATAAGITDYFDDIPNGVYLNWDLNNPAEHNPGNFGLVLAFGYGVSYKARLFLGFISTTNHIIVKVATRTDSGLWMNDTWKEIFNE